MNNRFRDIKKMMSFKFWLLKTIGWVMEDRFYFDRLEERAKDWDIEAEILAVRGFHIEALELWRKASINRALIKNKITPEIASGEHKKVDTVSTVKSKGIKKDWVMGY